MFVIEKDEISTRTCYWIRTANTRVHTNVSDYCLRAGQGWGTLNWFFGISFLNFSYEPEDALEWALVLDEIKGFIKAEAAVAVLHADSNPIVLSHRSDLMST